MDRNFESWVENAPLWHNLSSQAEAQNPAFRRRRGGREQDPALRLLGHPAPLQLTAKDHGKKPGDFIAGFTPTKDVVHLPFFPPPVVPVGFVARHTFPPPLPPMSGKGLFPGFRALAQSLSMCAACLR